MIKSKCKNCVHYEVCRIRTYPSQYGLTGDGCDHFTDKSLIVDLPCKVGITLYFIYNRPYADKPSLAPKIYETNEWYFEVDDKEVIICPRIIHGFNGNYWYHLGETVFTNKEDAEAKLKEI